MTLKNKLGLIITASLVAGFFLTLNSQAQYSSSGTAGTVESPDAIGVRVVPNPNHYSITRWYESQGFQGSPQALLVDGYEAIRDGRTVYVSAANIDQNSKKIYTNIYLISYNQDSAAKTVDILGQIISHWKFNSNLVENGVPTCSISSVSCLTDSECGTDQFCAPASTAYASSGIASSSCALKTAKNCLVDSDCPASFFCNSLKAKITRDMKRIGRLEELKEALFNYKKANGRYPTLSAGTYLPGHTVSLWPSWSQTFLPNLAVSQNFLDPVNRLGACPGYDAKTCWNKETQKFAYNPTGNSLVLPADSQALVYSVDSQGSNYNLCGTMESRESSLGGYQFDLNNPTLSPCVLATGIASGGQATNTPPQLVEKSLIGEANQEFNGFIKVIDKENNPLAWTLNTYSSSGWAGWSGAPILKDTSNPNQKKVYASKAGSAGTYNMTLTVTDGQGGTLTTSTPIKILSSMISIEADDEDYVLDPINKLTYDFSFTSNNLNSASPSLYSVTRYPEACLPGSTNCTNGTFDILSVLTKAPLAQVASNTYKVSYSGLIPTTQIFTKDTDFKYKITVTDKSGNSADKDFTIRVKLDKPLMEADCPTAIRKDMSYGCYLGPARQGNFNINYSATGLPAGLSVVNQSQSLIGTTTAITTGTLITLKATNDYGVYSTKNFNLRVNNYCGDGIKQAPNMEERGGLYNDGYEDCDGTDGVIASGISKDKATQYGCMTTAGTSRPYPILTRDQCVFRSPLDGGGYCGDGYCQTQTNGVPRENTTNCPEDCGVGASTIPPITLSGKVTDYMTSDPLSGVSIAVVDASGAPVGSKTTDANGVYSLSLAASTELYRITAKLSGYTDGTADFTPDANQVIDFSLASPNQSGVARIQLSWDNVAGAHPDLDSHLTYHTNQALVVPLNNPSHIYYANKCDVHNGGLCDLINSTALLDRDDVNAGGLCSHTGDTCNFNQINGYYFRCTNYPNENCADDNYAKGLENVGIKIYKLGNTYKYFVYDWTHKGNPNTCSFAGATVKIFNGGGAKIKEYVATTTPGRCYWNVFSLSPTGTSTAAITKVDTYSNSQP